MTGVFNNPLNYQLQATVTTVMVRFAMWVAAATIGQVRLSGTSARSCTSSSDADMNVLSCSGFSVRCIKE